MMYGGVTDLAPLGKNRSLGNRGMPSSGLQLRCLRRIVRCKLLNSGHNRIVKRIQVK
jgi:hypothetical protein